MAESSDEDVPEGHKKELWKVFIHLLLHPGIPVTPLILLLPFGGRSVQIFGENLAGKTAKKSGMLWKLGGVFKTWKERHFLLHGNYLSYFPSAESLEPLGTIILDKWYS